jgi:ComF family protein
MRTLSAKLLKLTATFFPSQCLLCACTLRGDLLCTNCQVDLPHSYGQLLCQQCGISIESLSNFCGHCLHHPPAYSRSFIPFAYQYPLDHLIHAFKYRRNLTSGKLLGQMLADYLTHCAQEHEDWVVPELIIPAPMHWLRRWQRGFNQAEVLGHYVARELKLPLATHIIKRTHKTNAQKELSRTERQQNLRKAFSITEKNRIQINGKRIALIDDVVTTTATVRELSHLLVEAGAKDVQVWALARTM